jgi:hypothetical protein
VWTWYKEGTRLELGQLVCEEKINLEQEFAVGREPPFTDDLSMAAEEELLLDPLPEDV